MSKEPHAVIETVRLTEKATLLGETLNKRCSMTQVF